MDESKLFDILHQLKKMQTDLEKLIYTNKDKAYTYFTGANTIIELVNNEFEIDCTDISRTKSVTEARHCALYLMNKYTKLSHREKSAIFKRSTHCTSIHSIQKANDLIDTDETYRKRVLNIENKLDILLQRI